VPPSSEGSRRDQVAPLSLVQENRAFIVSHCEAATLFCSSPLAIKEPSRPHSLLNFMARVATPGGASARSLTQDQLV
jgi:hypothetical protein